MAARAYLSFLAETPSDERDRPLRPEEFHRLWVHFERYTYALLVNRLRRHSLHKACEYAGGSGASDDLLATPGAVRGALAEDQDLIDDLMQEVAITLLRAVRGGELAAAAPVVKSWLRTTVQWIVPRASRPAAIHYFGRGMCAPEDALDQDDSLAEAVAREPDAATLVEQRELVGHVRLLIKELKLRDKLVLERWLQDVPHAEIAGELGLSEEHVRVLLCRTLKRLRNAAHDRATSVPEARRRAPPIRQSRTARDA